MIIKLYQVTDSNNVIGKTLGVSLDFNILFKDTFNLSRPSIILETELNILQFNYCYITDLDRYYFISDIEVDGMSLYKLDFRLDVLESFKDDILNSKGMITKSNNDILLPSTDLKTEVIKECDIFYSDKILPKTSIVVSTIISNN